MLPSLGALARSTAPATSFGYTITIFSSSPSKHAYPSLCSPALLRERQYPRLFYAIINPYTDQLHVPLRLVRESIPDAVIGLFVHTPFPSSEVFRCLPRKFFTFSIYSALLGTSRRLVHMSHHVRHYVFVGSLGSYGLQILPQRFTLPGLPGRAAP
jgi:hypothetical protein